VGAREQAPGTTVIVIVGPRLDSAALIRSVRRAVPGAQITLRSRLLAAISGAPLPHGGLVTFAEGTIAAHALGIGLGCRVLRAHDARAARRVADVLAAVLAAA